MQIEISLIGLRLGREIKLKGNVPDLIAQSAVGHACVCCFSLEIPDVGFNELKSWMFSPYFNFEDLQGVWQLE